MDPQKLFRSNAFKSAWKIVLGLIVALMIFQLGMFVGFRKASFTFGWGDNYHRVFGGPQGGFMRDFGGNDLMNGHGLAGQVIKVETDSLIVKNRDNTEMVAKITDKTSLAKGRRQIQLSEIKIDDRVTVIGSEQADGSIEAKIVRVFDDEMFPFDAPMPQPRFP